MRPHRGRTYRIMALHPDFIVPANVIAELGFHNKSGPGAVRIWPWGREKKEDVLEGKNLKVNLAKYIKTIVPRDAGCGALASFMEYSDNGLIPAEAKSGKKAARKGLVIINWFRDRLELLKFFNLSNALLF